MKKNVFLAVALLALMAAVLAGCASMIVVSIDNESVKGPERVRQYGAIDPKAVTVYANYKDGSRKPLSIGKNDITLDSGKVGPQTVTVKTVKGPVSFETEVMALTGITVAAQPNYWKLGAQARVLRSSGGPGIQADPGNDQNYKNSWPGLEIQAAWDQMGSEKISADAVADDCQFSGFDPNKAGRQTVTVTWNGKQTSFNVQVVAVESIKITSLPAKTTFYQGESLDRSGLKVIATWPGIGEEDVTSKLGTFTWDPQKTGAQAVTVTYGDKTASFTIQILPGPVGTWGRKVTVQGSVIDQEYRFVSGGSYRFLTNGVTRQAGTYTFNESAITLKMTHAFNADANNLLTYSELLAIATAAETGWGDNPKASVDMMFAPRTIKWSVSGNALTLTFEGLEPEVYTKK